MTSVTGKPAAAISCITKIGLVDDAWPTLPKEALPRRRRGPAPEMSDSEVVTIALFIDSILM
jgi:hypothetical protein